MSENTALQNENEGVGAELAELPGINPTVDIFENDDGYLIRADVPGVTQDAIEVQFERGLLSLQARRPYEADGTRIGSEFGPVVFRRSFRIPERINADAISAKLANGVLELQLPKAADVKPRKITISS